VLVIGVLLVLLVIALSLFVTSLRAARERQLKTCRATLRNEGNIRSRFELRAEDPSGALRFRFTLDEANLAAANEPAVLHAVRGQTAALPAPAAEAPARGGGKRKPNQAVAAAKKIQEKGKGAVETTSTITSWMASVAYLVGGRFGGGLRRTATKVRRVQEVGREATEAPDRAGVAADTIARPVTTPPPMRKSDARRSCPPNTAVPASSLRHNQTSAIGVMTSVSKNNPGSESRWEIFRKAA